MLHYPTVFLVEAGKASGDVASCLYQSAHVCAYLAQIIVNCLTERPNYNCIAFQPTYKHFSCGSYYNLVLFY